MKKSQIGIETLHITAQDTVTLTAHSVGLAGLVHFNALYPKIIIIYRVYVRKMKKMKRIWRQ